MMVEQGVNDMRIAGVGSSSGGTYRDVTVAGVGTLDGDIRCRLFKVGGMADVHGSLTAETVDVGGVANFAGDVAADEMDVGGTADIRGRLTGGRVRSGGVITVGGGVDVQRVELRGVFTIEGDCQAEVFDGRGAFKVKGLLNAGTIDVQLWGRCEVREMGGERVNVREGRGFAFFLEQHLYAETIEADEVRLEDTTAKVVRGKLVEVGPGCDIELVEYVTDFKQTGGTVATARMVDAGA